MKRLIYFLFIFFAGTSFSQNYTALNGPYGGSMYDLITSNGLLIGSVPGQGVVISADNGTSWTESNTGLTVAYAYDLERDGSTGKIYALTYNRLFSSSDDGASWITEASTGFSDGFMIKRTASHFFIVSRYDGRVYRSVTGTSWFLLATLPGVTQILDFDVNASGHLFISTYDKGIFKSTDNGGSFTNLDAGEGLTDVQIYSLAFNGTDIYALGTDFPWKSTNSGSTWTAIENPGFFPGDTYYGSKIECSGGNVYIFRQGDYWMSSDGGASWSEFNHPSVNYGVTSYTDTECVLIENTSNMFVSIGSIGTFRTTDGGFTWAEKNNGVTGFSNYSQNNLLFAATSNRIFYAKGYPFGIHVSIDDGASFDFLTSAPHDKQIVGFKKFGADIFAFGAGINKSSDNGITWTETNNSQVTGPCSSVFFGNIVAVGSNAYSYYEYDCSTSTPGYFLVKSTDNGVTWEMQALTGMPSASSSYVNAGEMHTDGLGNIYFMIYNYTTGVNKNQVYKIDPVALTAVLVSNLPTVSGIQDVESNNGKLYVLTQDNKVHITSDGAASWTTKATTSNAGNFRAINDNTFYILNSIGANISTDGGDSWTNSGSFGNNRSAHEVVISPANFSYVLVDYAGIHKSNATVIPPAPPTGLSVMGVTASSAILTWTDNSTNEDYFIVEVSMGDNLNYDSIGTATRPSGFVQTFATRVVTTYVNEDDDFTFFQPNTTYFARVRAKGAAGKSAYATEVSFTTQSTCDPASIVPANRSWTATSSTASNSNIALPGGTASFQIPTIGLGAAGAFNGAVFVNVNCLESVVTSTGGALANGNGTWDPVNNVLVVKWRNAASLAAFQETVTYTLNAVDPAPPAVTGLSAYVKTSNEIVVTWLNATYAQSYQVHRSTTSGFTPSAATEVGGPIAYPTTYFLDNFAFAVGTTYYYKIVATSNGGGSSTSAEFGIQMQTPKFEATSLPGYDLASQGIAWIDLDNDDDEDLLVSPFGGVDQSIVSYENLGNGSFQQISMPGVSDLLVNTSRTISVGDINNDNLLDFISNAGTDIAGGEMFLNLGNKEFQRTNIVPPPVSTGQNWYASLADFNSDGRLDAVFTEDDASVVPQLTRYKFFTQNVSGVFEPYEIGEIAAETSSSRGGSWADFDNDGDQDFIRTKFGTTAADFDQLYVNNGDATFSLTTGTAFDTDFNLAPRTISWADFDNDLDLDVFIGHNLGAPNNMLYQNNNDGTFTRLTSSLPAEPKTAQTFGSSWGDVDNDGDLDLVVANTLQCVLYLNSGAGAFTFTKYVGTEYLVASDANRTNVAFAMADYDKNGTLDIATGKIFGALGTSFPSILLKNTLVPDINSRWLQIELAGTLSNRAGIGARIIITTPDAKKQMRTISAHTGYGSCNSLIAHFGLYNQPTVSSIEVHWPSGVVQTLPAQAANQLIKITEDGTGPGITTYLPASGASAVSTATHIAVDLNEASTAVASKKLYLYKTSDLITAVFSADLTTAVKTGDHYEFTLPNKLLTNTDYTIAIDGGAFIDVWGNPSSVLATGTWNFHTAPGPAATLLAPVHNATNVATNAPLEITFNMPVTAVAGKKIKVTNGVTTVLDLDVSTNGTFSGNKYTLTPTTNWAYLAALQASVDPGAFIDASQNDFAGIASGNWNFTIVEAPDVTPPVIAFDQSTVALTLDKGFANIPVSLTITDNKQVSSATLFHRKISEKPFQSVSLSPNVGNGKWEGTIQSSFADEMGFEYYFEASDGALPAENKGRKPEAANTYYRSKITFTGSNLPNFTLPSGGTRASWKMISIPHELEEPQVASIFEQLGAANNKEWRLIHYTNQPKEEWLQYPKSFSTIERGKGYFINTKDGGSITLNNASSPEFTRDNLFTLNLVQGFNQVGNPYTIAINWSDVIAYNPHATIVIGSLKKFSGGSYTSGDNQLPVFQGAFVHASGAITIKIPFDGQNTPGGGRKTFADLGTDINAEEWGLSLNLRQGEFNYDLGSVGMALDANSSFDGYDDITPPRFFDFLEMNFHHPEYFSDRFTRDIVPTQNSYTWEFTVDSNLDGPATISWDNTPFALGSKDIFLLDIARQKLVNMKERGSYSFYPKESINFRVYFGEDLNISPDKVQLGKAYPNPTSGNTLMAFSLPESGGLQQLVTLDIVDAMGRVLGTISKGRFNPGFHEVSWNAKEVNNGFYTYRLTVQGAQGKTTQVNKLVIK